VVLLAILFVSFELCAAPTQPLKFAVNAPGSFPYLFFDSQLQGYKGVLPDFMEFVAQKSQLNAIFVDSNPSRSEQFLADGKVDLLLVNMAWLNEPQKFITSLPLIQHATYLYSLQPFGQDFSLTATTNSRICTREGFVYPGLSRFFQQNQFLRVDVSSQAGMPAMLVKQRCDYMVMNNFNAHEAFSQAQFCQLALYQSPKPTSIVPLYIVMRPQLLETRKQIDRYLQAFIDSGRLQASFTAHAPNVNFPLLPRCVAN
jgi:polar amino acid transport system substrate-binding protein